MKLFGRRKAGDDYEGDEELKLAKKKRNNPRKKKEPVKPWGKKERLLILLLLILTAGGSGLLALSAREWKLPGLPRVKLSMPSIPFITSEKVVLEGESHKNIEKASSIVSEFTEKTKDLSGVYGLYMVDLNSGFSFGINDHETFQAASLIKLPVMITMYTEYENERINLEDKYTLKYSDKVAGAGSLYYKQAGYEVTYRNLVRLMGKESDNTAFNIVRNLLGDEKVNDAIVKIGMKGTSLEENETTPEDIGEFFNDLWLGNIVNEDNKEELLGYLTDTTFEAWITAGLPDDIRFAHKYSREVHVVNDAGIVYSDSLPEPDGSQNRRPFVIVIMSKGVVEREADSVIPEISRSIYEIWIEK
jgi:beta-lactamase class A